MTRLIVGPFNRVEGDLEVKLDIDGDHVKNAYVTSPLYRGFEQILHGKPLADALVYAPRICGICSVSQSVAAAKALSQVEGVDPPANGQRSINLIHATENVADHLTHFYLFFMPDFVRAIYQDEPWYSGVQERFTAFKGSAHQQVLPARAQFMHVMGILAGKWPHTLSIRPGGSVRSVSSSELVRLSGILAMFRRFLEQTLFGDDLERVIELSSAGELAAWAAERPPASCDFRHFLHISDALRLDQVGRAGTRFMSYGAYGGGAGPLFARGVYDQSRRHHLDADQITEDLSHAWYSSDGGPQRPIHGVTHPDGEQRDGYTWCKAPRLDGRVMEVGAVARQLVDGHPLIVSLVEDRPANVHVRVVARILEIARVVVAMEHWLGAVDPGERFIAHGATPDEATGRGLTEAARGSLGHWLTTKGGHITNYQIVAPTTWNFSPRDAAGTPGALEQALVGAPIRPGETEPVAVQHIVRSFDPCLVCTVH